MCWLGASAPSTDAGLITRHRTPVGPAWISWRRMAFHRDSLSCGLVKSIDSYRDFQFGLPGWSIYSPTVLLVAVLYPGILRLINRRRVCQEHTDPFVTWRAFHSEYFLRFRRGP